MGDGWNGNTVRRARAYVGTLLPAPCGRCGQVVTADMAWDVGHIVDQVDAPELAMDPSNWRPEHSRCNRAAGGRKGRSRQLRPRRYPAAQSW